MATSLPVFGLGAEYFSANFNGFNFNVEPWITRIPAWLQIYAAKLKVVLRAQGYDVNAVTEEAEEELYQLCRGYLEAEVSRRIAMSIAHDEPALAKSFFIDARDQLRLLRELPEALSANATAAEVRGTLRTPEAPRRGARAHHSSEG